MFCERCGTENNNDARFCRNCGVELKKNQSQAVSENMGKSPKKKGSKIWVIIGIIFLIGAIALAVSAGLKHKEEKKIQENQKEYEQLIAKADKYFEELDYDGAEESYLNAIQIDPKQEKPYLKLADLYVVQERYDEAVEILTEAESNVEESSDADKSVEEKSEITKKKEEISGAVSYNWIVDPTLDFDNMYYLQEDGKVYAENDLQRQDGSAYAVMKKGDTYGLIKEDGSVIVDLEYKEIYKFNNLWIMNRKVPKYDSEYQQEWSQYAFDEGKNAIVPIELGGGGITGGIYYYDNGLKNSNQYISSYEILNGSPYVFKIPENAIPVQESIAEYVEGARDYWEGGLSEKYAIYYQNGLKTDFIYEECGSDVAGLLAVKKGGKWGYIDEEGNVVIPIEYDASWKGYVKYDYAVNERISKDYCYAVSEGYIPLVKDGIWEMRNIKNEIAILPGVFEQILPVHNGRCWVKKNGKWGVIQMNDSM